MLIFSAILNKSFAAVNCTAPAACYPSFNGCPTNYTSGETCILGVGTPGATGGICCTAPDGGGGDTPPPGGEWGNPANAPALDTVTSLLNSKGPTRSWQSLTSLTLSLLFLIVIILALFYLIWGGFDWLTSGGEKQGITKARDKIFYAIIGLIVAFVSYLIVNIITNFFRIN